MNEEIEAFAGTTACRSTLVACRSALPLSPSVATERTSGMQEVSPTGEATQMGGGAGPLPSTLSLKATNCSQLSISEHPECPEMDTSFYAITDYQRVTSLARKLLG